MADKESINVSDVDKEAAKALAEARETSEEAPLDEDKKSEEGEEDKEAEDKAPKEPPVRKSKLDYIRERQAKRAAQKAVVEEPDEEEGEDEDIEEGDELSPAARKALQKELSPVLEALKSQEDEAELRQYLAENPEDKKLEASVRKYMASPAYSKIPVAFIFSGLKGQGGDKAAEAAADKEAKEQAVGGKSSRASGGLEKDAWDIPQAEFDQEVNKIIQKGK